MLLCVLLARTASFECEPLGWTAPLATSSPLKCNQLPVMRMVGWSDAVLDETYVEKSMIGASP